jgi:hypothetical protein
MGVKLKASGQTKEKAEAARFAKTAKPDAGIRWYSGYVRMKLSGIAIPSEWCYRGS